MQTKIKITGMHCGSCRLLLEDVARDVPGVVACTIDTHTQTGIIEHNETFDFAALAKEIAALNTYRIEKYD